MCEISISQNGSTSNKWAWNGCNKVILNNHKHESYTTIHGLEINTWIAEKMVDIFEPIVYKNHAKTGRGLLDMECILCGHNYNNYIINHAYSRKFGGGFLRNDIPRFSVWMVFTMMTCMQEHLSKCRSLIEIKKEFIRNSANERERLLEMINEYMKHFNVEIENYAIDVEKYSFIISASYCQCNRSIVVNCKICGSNHKIKKRGNSVLSTYSCTQTYKSIVRSHLTNVKGSVKYDYRDIITPINKKVYIGDGVHNWTHDGYKCSICGVEYEKTGNKLDSMPDKIIVLAHAAKCIPDNQEAISASGRHCI